MIEKPISAHKGMRMLIATANQYPKQVFAGCSARVEPRYENPEVNPSRPTGRDRPHQLIISDWFRTEVYAAAVGAL